MKSRRAANPASRAPHRHPVAYTVWQFYQVTSDLAYLIDYGTEMLIEIARFWVSRARRRGRDRYGILGVIGPDEFHSGYPDRPYAKQADADAAAVPAVVG